MPASNWWALRRRFQQTPPRGEVDAAYLAGVLSIGEAAARNLIPALRAVGLIDDAGRPTDRAMAWRDDEHYGQAATAMIEAIYPQSLRDVAPPPNPDRGAVERWFLRDTGTGQAAAERMARFYELLAAGDPAAADRPAAERPPQQQAQRPARPPRDQQRSATRTQRDGPAATGGAGAERVPDAAPATGTTRVPPVPSLHVDIQVHIDPAATAEQIDQIFASMARHLYGRE